jgi:hypothetical protein
MNRRNLIAISMFLIVFDLSTSTLDKVALFGMDLRVERPRALIWLAWLVWFYFVVRYLQYLFAETDLQTKGRRFNERIHEYAKDWAAVPEQDSSDGQPAIKLVRERFHWNLIIEGYDISAGSKKVEDVQSVSLIRMCLWNIRAATYMTICTQYVTDFVLPLLIAIAAPVSAFVLRR